MKNVLISIGGDCNSNVSNYNLNFEQIIAVDSGIKHIYKLSLDPSILVGDLDSISKEDYQKVKETNIEIDSYHKNKDLTDFELSLNKVVNPHKKNIFIIGGEGGDIDHMLSVFFIISNKEFYQNITWLYGKQTILFKNNFSLEVDTKMNFSLIPLTDIKSLYIKGAKWELENKNIEMGNSFTLRNQTEGELLRIYCEKGRFALIY
jgi:thiamine pyrophosphokinase